MASWPSITGMTMSLPIKLWFQTFHLSKTSKPFFAPRPEKPVLRKGEQEHLTARNLIVRDRLFGQRHGLEAHAAVGQ